ncbi:MAG TPA: tetratricopeptide repeat protein, partial [Gemmatimonadaceae bacterium]|nr:tetratricopeptide repeat protein [Gemmatimonadaceae bacterium]
PAHAAEFELPAAERAVPEPAHAAEFELPAAESAVPEPAHAAEFELPAAELPATPTASLPDLEPAAEFVMEPVAAVPAPAEPALPRGAEDGADLMDLPLEFAAPEAPAAPATAAAAEDETPTAHDPFATETMAELYLSQGHADEALRVYRQLLQQNPGDARIEQKLANILAMSAPTPVSGSVVIPEPPIADAFEMPPAAPEAAEAVPQAVPDFDATAFAMPEPEPEPAPAVASSAPELDAANTGPTIREFLAAIALHVPGSTPAASMPAQESMPAPEPAPIEPAAPALVEAHVEAYAEAQVEVAAAAAPTVSGTLDALFGGANVRGEDARAAEVLASAFQFDAAQESSDSAAEIAGAPARRASSEISLDTVFREGAPAQEQQPSGFSFDQFFAPPTPAAGTPMVNPSTSAPPAAASADDIAQFTSWLEGLKKK